MKIKLYNYLRFMIYVLFYILVSINIAKSEELFGIKLYQNSKDILSIDFINTYKKKDIETKSGFWFLPINKINSPYFKNISIIIDNEDYIHQIQGLSFYNNIEKYKNFLKTYTNSISRKKGFKLNPYERDYGTFIEHSFSVTKTSSFHHIGCINNFSDKTIYMFYNLRTSDYANAVSNFYSQD